MRTTVFVFSFWVIAFFPQAHAQWNHVGGQATDIGVGANDHVWCIGWDDVPGGHSIHRWNGSYWEKKPGGAVRIDVDPKGNAWCVNNEGLIFYWNGNDWVNVGGQARDVGIGANGTVWIVGWDAVPGGFSIHRWNGSYWEKKPGGAVRIDVDPKGNAWCVNKDGLIFYWNGNDWVNVGGQGRDISISANGQVWLVGWNSVHGGFSIHRWKGTSWSNEAGGMTNISVGNNQIWSVNSVGGIFIGNWLIAMSMLDGAIISLRCLGDVDGARWLDGRTQSATVGLAPSTDGIYTGTKWQLMIAGYNGVIPLFALKCLGSVPGNRWLEGFVVNANFPNRTSVRLASNNQGKGARWYVSHYEHNVITLENFPQSENRYLDGRTRDGTVGLAPFLTNLGFSGTKWEVVRRQ